MKNKKIVLWIALVIMAIIPIYAQQYDSEKNFRIKNVNDGVEITEYIGSKREVHIPPSIQNNPVTRIGDEAFFKNNNITSIIIPDSVTSIGKGAFYGCTSLTSVSFEGMITSGNLDGNAFGFHYENDNYIGNLRIKYLIGGIGTYKRERGGYTWEKQ